MKKQVVALLFGFVSLLAFLPELSAQSTEAKLQKLYMDFLLQEKLEGSVDGDGDVQFNYNDHTYFLEVNEGDEEFFRVVLPNIWPIESAEEGLEVLQACDVVNRSMKCTKAYVANDNVWIAVELFVAEPAGFKDVFYRCLAAIENGLNAFVEEM